MIINFKTLPYFEFNQILILFFLLSLLIGSFLNVVIYRLPEMIFIDWRQQAREFLDLESQKEKSISLCMPRSHCRQCLKTIRFWENIPVLSWLLLKGKCSHCKIEISIRYPLIEILTAGLSVLIGGLYGLTVEGLLMLIITYYLIVIALIDFDHQIIPDCLVLPLLWIILIATSLGYLNTPSDAILGAVAGYLSLWSVYWVYKICRNQEGLGHGDFKLMAVFGALLGAPMLVSMITISAILGLLIALPMLLKKADFQEAIPFGPAIILSGWVHLLASGPFIF
ncbi:MAG TPA: prepilin peptidase [Methylococcaceae bacterium]|jgi:leader peptidase (prepilin peptidase)/N-methyltransferase|nr:prepilin peptidase [Methylococcaceae bacterium]HIA45662.1 prepilin peptidase [Methylococcaceae bacterium]HIB62256.1 prepilin peptidase [Methylococcaceae bacterium]HIO13404.1 prepilin peptidase [Methylococcales bacterium]HIO44242.1 prepilin peptidase [Methylococcales bacterium]